MGDQWYNYNFELSHRPLESGSCLVGWAHNRGKGGGTVKKQDIHSCMHTKCEKGNYQEVASVPLQGRS